MPTSVRARPALAHAPARAAARKTPLPATLSPELATLAAAPPSTPDDWLYELKFDGYRLLTRIEGDTVRCMTRNGKDWSARLPALVRALARLRTRSAWLDGEIVVEAAGGAPDFQALQNAFDSGGTAAIVYWLFDCAYLDGEDLRALPIEERRARLARLLGSRPTAPLRLSRTLEGRPDALLATSARQGYEGIVGKRKGSPYVTQRSPDWIKLKNQRRQEFVIGGYTAPKGSRSGFGSLLLGVYEEQGGGLVYCGNVGTGFDQSRLADIKSRLDRHASQRCPFATPPRGVKARWVEPVLVCEVSFGEWTREGRVRHSAFQGLRIDKPAAQIRRETAAAPEATHGGASRNKESHTMDPHPHISHAERVIDPQSGVTKGELAAFYERVAECMLPHLLARPVALLRAPDGVGGELFFQKHRHQADLTGIRLLDPALDPGHDPLLQVEDARGLLSAAQMNVIEFHTWNARSDTIGKPDRMTFDLDPGEGLAWELMQQATHLLQLLLDELELPAFLKTSGGKGLHVVVPLRRQYDWDTVKGFSQAVVQHLARIHPDRVVAKSGPRNRVGKIFVDYLRNGFGATTVSAWSARSRPGLGVSVPLAWDELPDLRAADQWTVRNIGERIALGNRPWADYEKSRAALGPAMQRLGHAPSSGTGQTDDR